MFLPFHLREPVSPDRLGYNRLNDTLKLKRGLQTLGFYKSSDEIYTPGATEAVFNALSDFQRAHNLKVDATANPDGPTEHALNAALAKVPPQAVLRHAIAPADPDTARANARRLRGMRGSAGSGDYPAFMAATLYSTDGGKAAPEIADFYRQTHEGDRKEGAKMRAQLAQQLAPEDMTRIDDAAGVAEIERAAPKTPAAENVLDGGGGGDKPNSDRTPYRGGVEPALPAPTDQPVDPGKLRKALGYKDFGLGDVGNMLVHGPVVKEKVETMAKAAENATAKMFPGERMHNDEADAYRHALWSFKMAREISPDIAKKVGDGHERKPLTAYDRRNYERYTPAPES